MELTDEQLTQVRAYLEQKKPLRKWMNDNSLGQADVRPRQIIEQLKAKYGEDDVKELISSMREANYGQQFTMMTRRLLSQSDITVGQCDALLAKLQDAIVTVQAKKAELQAG